MTRFQRDAEGKQKFALCAYCQSRIVVSSHSHRWCPGKTTSTLYLYFSLSLFFTLWFCHVDWGIVPWPPTFTYIAEMQRCRCLPLEKGGLTQNSKDLLCCLLKGNSMQQCILQRLVFWGELDWPGFSELTGVHKGKCINMHAHNFNTWAFKI